MTNEALADLLAIGPDWRAAMLAVPRHAFVPAVAFASPDDGTEPYPIDRQARPDEWLRAVYSDTAIVTQRDSGAGDPAANVGEPTSSLSAPGIAFRFLELLETRDHDRVLEVGTGTGYTAAVLSARLGDHAITSIEVDPEVSKQAAANLETAGYAPNLIIGDAAIVLLDGGPFDRIHATCAVRTVPYTWIEHLRPGGVIVAPWQPSGHNGMRLRLTVAGADAYGRFHGRCGYMVLRSQGRNLTWKAHHADQANTSSTALDPRTIHQAGDGAALVIAARVPELAVQRVSEADGSFSLLLSEAGKPEGSWAACDYEPGKNEFVVTQYGHRLLWDEVADAFLRWIRLGSPGSERFGLAVSPTGERLWLDDPSRIV